jgi:hypothetical protein
MNDQQKRIALAYGKAILARMAGGSTLGQAVNQAYGDVNPTDNLKIRVAIVASMVGVDLDAAQDRFQHRLAASKEDSGDIPPPVG